MGWVLFWQILIFMITFAILLGSLINTYWDRKAMYFKSTRKQLG